MSSSAVQPAPAVITLRRGTLRLSGGTYEQYFAGCHSVILLPREGHLLILPAASSGGGGSILKVVNARGDRGVAAAELFRELGVGEAWLEGDREACFEAHWSREHAGLVIEHFYSRGPR